MRKCSSGQPKWDVLKPASQLVASPTEGLAPLTVQFTNVTSGATNYSWDFGDGQSSTDKDPGNTYTNAGVYDVMPCNSSLVTAPRRRSPTRFPPRRNGSSA